MSKIITSFSHKGGVGKTTLLHNIAHKIAEKNKKVLLVDIDTQCNLTAACHGLSTSISYSTTEEKQWMDIVNNNLSILDIANGITKDAEKTDGSYLSKTLAQDKHNKNIYCISGSQYLAEFETLLFRLTYEKEAAMRPNIPYRFEEAIRDIATIHKCDYILIDTSPSAISLLNAVCVLMSDYFYVPVTPTFFAKQAVDSLYDLVLNWREKLQTFTSAKGGGRFDLRTKFAGIVINQGKVLRRTDDIKGEEDILKKGEQGRLFEENIFAGNVKDWSQEINKSLKNVADRFNKYGGFSITDTQFKKIFGNNANPFIISQIQNYTSQIRAVSDETGKPVVLCKKTDDVRINQSFYENVLKTFSDDMDFLSTSFMKLLDNVD